MGKMFKFQCVGDQDSLSELGFTIKEYLYRKSVPLADPSLYLAEDQEGNQLIVRHLNELACRAEVYLPKDAEAAFVWPATEKGVDQFILAKLEMTVKSLELKKAYEKRIAKLEAYEEETLWRITKDDLACVISDSNEVTRDLPEDEFENLCQSVLRDFSPQSWNEELSIFVEMKELL